MQNKLQGALFSFLFLMLPTVLLAQSAQEYRQMGEAIAQKGLYARAVDYYQQAVAADPNDWQSYQDMGDAYLQMNNNAEALGAYQKCLQINPDDSTAQTHVNSLTASGVQAQAPAASASPAQAAPSSGSQFNESQPLDQEQDQTVVVKRRRPRPAPAPTYNDNLAPMDHSKFWTSFAIGYSYSANNELAASAKAWNTDISNNGWSGSALSANDGLDLAFKLGFLLDTNNGLALGVKYVSIADYNLNVNYNNGPATDLSGNIAGSDFEQTTLSPYIIPITLDYYLFLPDHDGRFFLSAGVGYYFGDVHATTNYSYLISNGTPYDTTNPGYPDTYTGDLTAGAPGFQVSLGRDFAISRTLSLSLFVEARYAKLTNFQGILTDSNGNSANIGLATEPSSNNEVFLEDVTTIGNGNKYTTIDFTGVDGGLALNFYTL